MAFDPSIITDSNKLNLTLDSSPISADQTDFPLTIQLDSANPLHAPIFEELGANSKKLSIDVAGTQCPVEIESWGDLVVSPFAYADTSPINHWTLDNISGTTLIDEMGNTNGDIEGMVLTAGGPFENYLKGGNLVTSGYGVVLDEAVIFESMSVWVNRDFGTTTAYMYIAKIAGYTLALFGSGGGYKIGTYNGGWFGCNLTVSDNNWHHVVLTYDSASGNYWVWLDGVKSTTTILIPYIAGITDIGEDTIGGPGEVPSMANMQLYDYVLTASEVAALYESQVPVATLHTKIPSYTGSADQVATLSWDATQPDNDALVHSAYFNGTDAVLTTPDSADWDFGTGDYTVECLINFDDVASVMCLISTYDGPTLGWELQWRGTTNILVGGYGDTAIIGEAWTPTPNTKYHLAVCRNGTDLRLFVDGVQLGSTVTDSTNLLGSTHGCAVGGLLLPDDITWLQLFKGLITGVAIHKGVALYTTDFTSPLISAEMTNDANTVLFLDFAEVGQGETPATIVDSSASAHTVTNDSANVSGELLWFEGMGGVGETGSLIAQQVWDANFVAVYHMAQDPSGAAPQILDSTSYANPGTSYGSMTSGDLIEGATGKMIEFDGTDDHLRLDGSALSDFSFIPNSFIFTIESLLKIDSIGSNQLFISNAAASSVRGFYFGWVTGTNAIRLITYNANGSVPQIDAHSTSSDLTDYAEHHIAVTGNASKDVEFFEDGVAKTTTVTASWHSLASGNAAFVPYIGSYAYSTPGAFLDGAIGELRISNVVRSDDWIKLTNLSLTDQLITWSAVPPATDFLLAYLSQPYDLEYEDIVVGLSQEYNITSDVVIALVQYYSIRMLLEFIQGYGDAPALYAVLEQYYWDAQQIVRGLIQKYDNAALLLAKLEQSYSGPELLWAALNQVFTLADEPLYLQLTQLYDVNARDRLIALLSQSYALATFKEVRRITSTVTIGGVAIKTSAVAVEFGVGSYCGSISLSLTDYAQWKNINYKDLVEVVVGVEAYSYFGVVTDINKSETHNRATFSVEAKSEAVLLDFPYATEIEDDDDVHGLSSEIVSRVAAREGQAVIWELRSDPPQTINTYSVVGRSPLQAIKTLVNELGGILQSDPDGTLRAVPLYLVDSDKLVDADPDNIYSAAEDFTVVSTDHVKRDGYNKYSVEVDSSGYTMETEEITPGHHTVKAYITPWTTTRVILSTSELTNVSIIPSDPPTDWYEELYEDELVEIKNGTGTTSKPILDLVSFDYDSRINLGDIDYTEEGIITLASGEKASSLVTVSYWSRCWKWDVYDTDVEKVQFILEVV